MVIRRLETDNEIKVPRDPTPGVQNARRLKPRKAAARMELDASDGFRFPRGRLSGIV